MVLSKSIINVVGIIAATTNMASVFPQAYKLWVTKDTDSFSWSFVLLLGLSSLCWVIYHSASGTYHALASDSTYLAFCIFVLYMMIRHPPKFIKPT